MFSIKSIENYCGNIWKDIGTLSKVLDCTEKLKNSKNPNDRLAKKDLNNLNYDSIATVAYKHSSVSPTAKKLKSYISKFHGEDMKSLKRIKETAQKLCDIKEIYKYENIKGTGLSELKKICESSSFLKNKVTFECSKDAKNISEKVNNFFVQVREANKKIKKFSHSSAKDPIKNEILIVNKYYASIKKEEKKLIKNFSDVKNKYQEIRDKILSEIGKLSEKNKNLAEIANRTSPEVTKQDEKDYEEKIKKFSEDFERTATIFNRSQIDESTFNYLKEFRTLEKEILANENNGLVISLPDAKKRMLTLDKRWKLFNEAVIKGNYSNNEKSSALGIIEKNLRKIKQINNSLKSNNENTVDIEEIEREVDGYMNNESTETLDVQKVLSSITIDNLEEKTKILKQLGNAGESIKKLQQKIGNLKIKHSSTYVDLFGLFVIRTIYIETLGFLIKTNEFLVECLKELDGNGNGKGKNILNSKAVNMFTKFSAIGCYTGVMLSIGCPCLAPVVAGLAVTAVGVQIAQIALSQSRA